MVYYTHWIVSEEIIFEYVTHNDHYLIYKLYNNEHTDKTFILIYHDEYKFTIVRETDFDMTIFENSPKAYFNHSVSSRNEFNSGSEYIRLERSIGCHKYISADNSIEAYKVFNTMNLNVNDLAKRENMGMAQVVYHFAPNLYAVNICTMYHYDLDMNNPDSSYIYIKYNDDTYQIRYEFNKGDVYFM